MKNVPAAFSVLAVLCIVVVFAGCPLPSIPQLDAGLPDTGIRGVVTIDGLADAGGVSIVAELQIQGKTLSVWQKLSPQVRSPARGTGSDVFATVTDGKGAFQLLDLPEGRYTISAARQHTRGALYQNVVVAARTVTQVDIVLTATGSMSGRVTLDGVASGAGAFAYVEGTSYIAATAVDGSFRILDVPIGTYDVLYYRDGYGSRELTDVVVQAALDTVLPVVDLTSSTGAVSGAVLLGDDLDPTGILVGLAGSSAAAFADGTGAYLLGGVLPGTYTLVASRPGYETAILPGVVVQAGKEQFVELVVLVPAGSSPVEAPAFVPPGGTYDTNLSVTLQSATPGTVIHYTIDGTTPTRASAAYGSPVPVTGDGAAVTIRAIAVRPGMHDSAVTSAAYAIDWARVSQPVFNPPAGAYAADLQVQILCSTPGASIRYTLDGTAPTEMSPLYGDSIPVSGDGTSVSIRAIALTPGLKSSLIAAGTFSIHYASGEVSRPSVTPDGYTGSVMASVSLACSTPGATIRYTLDGSTPTRTNGAIYSSPVDVYRSAALKAMAWLDGLVDSTIAEASFVLQPTETGAPQGSYPNWKERTVLTYHNLVRMAPQSYKDNYLGWLPTDPGLSTWTATHPLYWDYNLNQAARYRATELDEHGMLTHYSWRLTDDWSNPTMPFNERVAMYGATAYAENAATPYPDPWSVVAAFMDLPQYADTPFSAFNGHRYSIMNPAYHTTGTGYQHYWVVEYSPTLPALAPLVPAASHDFFDGSTITFWLGYYDVSGQAPVKTLLVLDGFEHELALDIGTASAGTYKLTLPRSATTRSYYFLAVDGGHNVWRYPGPGVYMTVGEGSGTQEYVAP